MAWHTPARLFLRNVLPENTTSTVWAGLQQWGLGAGIQHVHAARPRGYVEGNPVNFYVTYDSLDQVNYAVRMLNQQIFLSMRPVLAQVASPRDAGKVYPSQVAGKVEGTTPKMGPPMMPWRAHPAPVPRPTAPLPKAAVQADPRGDEEVGNLPRVHTGQEVEKKDDGGEKEEKKGKGGAGEHDDKKDERNREAENEEKKDKGGGGQNDDKKDERDREAGNEEKKNKGGGGQNEDKKDERDREAENEEKKDKGGGGQNEDKKDEKMEKKKK